MGAPPDFIAGRDLVQRAYEHASVAHSEGETDISHPVAVARLLAEGGFGEDAIAAALLHDVVEDTGEGFGSLESRFGPEVAGIVEAMTEDAGIADYGERKAEHRARVLAAGGVPAAMYAADKLARVRSYLDSGEDVEPKRLAHYRDTLDEFSAARPELPFLAELGEELPRLEARNEGAAA
jgi:(p)ppGpp synthase/HD superfamily hydrolase